MERKNFLTLLASLTSALSLPGKAAVASEPAELRRSNALVLSGGGARGAYQAGVIAALARKSGTRDGQPLPPFDIVCGSSIGALNGWFVATGQYTLLSQLWHTVGGEQIFVLKKRFAAVMEPDAGLLNRLYSALALEIGLSTNVRGILDSGHVERFIQKYINPATPVLVPFVFTVTNLHHERGELFYRAPADISEEVRLRASQAVRRSAGPSVIARPADDGLLQDAIRASASLPILLDPVELLGADGTPQEYVDGGIANNTPVDVARAVAKSVYAILLDPDQVTKTPTRNAIDVGMTSFTIAQRRIVENSLRATYLETAAKRAALNNPVSPETAEIFRQIFASDVFTLRPAVELPVEMPDFANQAGIITVSYQLGYTDAMNGWVPYEIPELP